MCRPRTGVRKQRTPYEVKILALIPVILSIAAAPKLTTKVLPKPDRPAALVRDHVLPDPSLTPGAVYLESTLEKIKRPDYSATVRYVTQSEKNAVFAEYGIDPKTVKPGEYEIDHLVPLSWGGSNDIRNLWPQSYKAKPLNAHVKDLAELEGLRMLRGGKITLAQAQREIATDWTKFYRDHVGPLPAEKPGKPAAKTASGRLSLLPPLDFNGITNVVVIGGVLIPYLLAWADRRSADKKIRALYAQLVPDDGPCVMELLHRNECDNAKIIQTGRRNRRDIRRIDGLTKSLGQQFGALSRQVDEHLKSHSHP